MSTYCHSGDHAKFPCPGDFMVVADAATPGRARREAAAIRSRAFARLWASPWSNAAIRVACARFEPRFIGIWRQAAGDAIGAVVPFVMTEEWTLPSEPWLGGSS